eukprot:10679217-Karenia_brevis.AAC.1
MGKPNLPDQDIERVRIGSLENPLTSRIWLCACLVRARLKAQAMYADTCFCAFGTPWRKATRFMYWNFSTLENIS